MHSPPKGWYLRTMDEITKRIDEVLKELARIDAERRYSLLSRLVVRMTERHQMALPEGVTNEPDKN